MGRVFLFLQVWDNLLLRGNGGTRARWSIALRQVRLRVMRKGLDLI